MKITLDNTMALAIDFQEKLMPVINQAENLQTRSKILFEGLKILNVPIVVSQQYTKGIGMTVPQIRETLGDEYFDKRAFSCCKDPDIMKNIESLEKKYVIVAGIETHICVLQTCLDLLDAGYIPVLITDCTSSRKAQDMETALLRLASEGVAMSTSESVLFELLGSATHPNFKEISKLIK